MIILKMCAEKKNLILSSIFFCLFLYSSSCYALNQEEFKETINKAYNMYTNITSIANLKRTIDNDTNLWFINNTTTQYDKWYIRSYTADSGRTIVVQVFMWTNGKVYMSGNNAINNALGNTNNRKNIGINYSTETEKFSTGYRFSNTNVEIFNVIQDFNNYKNINGILNEGTKIYTDNTFKNEVVNKFYVFGNTDILKINWRNFIIDTPNNNLVTIATTSNTTIENPTFELYGNDSWNGENTDSQEDYYIGELTSEYINNSYNIISSKNYFSKSTEYRIKLIYGDYYMYSDYAYIPYIEDSGDSGTTTSGDSSGTITNASGEVTRHNKFK